MATFAGCGLMPDLMPKDAKRFHQLGKKEYDYAQLARTDSFAESQVPIKLKFVDTNTWQTTATLLPGKYQFSVRKHDSAWYGQEITIEQGKRSYEVPDLTARFTAPVQEKGPRVLGTISPLEPSMPVEVIVVFLNTNFTVRRAEVKDGKFSVEAPGTGRYRILVHATGNPPRSWSHDTEIAGPKDLGVIGFR